MNNAPGVPRDRFFAMTRLDENRAKTQLAKKASVDITAVTNLAIWGNHSSTMYPDFFNAKIDNRPVHRRHRPPRMAGEGFHRHGAAARRGHHQGARPEQRRQRRQRRRRHRPRARRRRRRPGDWFSVAVCSDGSYGIEKGLMFSYPIRSDGKKWEIVQGVPINEFSRAKITATENELKEEKSLVAELLPK